MREIDSIIESTKDATRRGVLDDILSLADDVLLEMTEINERKEAMGVAVFVRRIKQKYGMIESP